MPGPGCAIFDLDGTLADTRKDIARSVNLTRWDHGLESLPLETIVSYTGDGAARLLERSFAGSGIDLREGLKAMVDHYRDHPVVDTALYPGVAEGLGALRDGGWRLGVVTNKPADVARTILARLEVMPCLDAVVGGGDGFPLKPAPDAALALLRRFGADPARSWILGDNHTDMDCAAASGMNGAFAEWGFGSLGRARCTARVRSFPEFVRRIGGGGA